MLEACPVAPHTMSTGREASVMTLRSDPETKTHQPPEFRGFEYPYKTDQLSKQEGFVWYRTVRIAARAHCLAGVGPHLSALMSHPQVSGGCLYVFNAKLPVTSC